MYILQTMHHNLLILDPLTSGNVGKVLGLPKMPCGLCDRKFPIQRFTRTQLLVRVCFEIAVKTKTAVSQCVRARFD